MKRKEIDLSAFDEPRLTAICQRMLAPHFELEQEVSGVYLVDGSRVRIDLLAIPKQSLIDRGFTDLPIGIEIKSPASKASSNAFAWQAITYAQSEFKGERPAFVCMFPDVRYFWPEQTAVKMRQFLQFANVGQLETGSYQSNWDQWRIVFNSTYYSVRYGLGGVAPEGLKRRSGNSG